MIFGLVLLGVACLITVLCRVLSMGIGPDLATTYYSRTPLLFIGGASLAIVGAVLDMFSNFIAG